MWYLFFIIGSLHLVQILWSGLMVLPFGDVSFMIISPSFRCLLPFIVIVSSFRGCVKLKIVPWPQTWSLSYLVHVHR